MQFNPYIAAGQREQGQQDQQDPAWQPQPQQQQQQQQPMQPFQPPGQPQQQQQPPPVDVPFTQADSLQLQRLQQGQSEVQRQIDDGEVTEEDGQDLHRQLMARLTPLQQKQQQAQQKAQQAQKAALMDQTALQESMQAHHAQTQAQAFPSTVATYTDPVTGRTAHFYQDKRGNFKEMEFTVAKSDEPPIEQGTATGEAGPSTIAASPGGEGASAPGGQTGPMTLADYGAIKREQVGAGAKPGSPKILNALGQEIPHKDEYRGPRDVWGRPTQSPGGDEGFAELRRRAEGAIPQVQPNAPEWMHRQRSDAVEALFGRMTARHLGALEHREREQAAQAEHTRGEQARATEHQRQEQAKAAEHQRKQQAEAGGTEGKPLSAHEELQNLHHREAEVEKKYADWAKDKGNLNSEGKLKSHPDGWDNPVEREHAAARLHHRDLEVLKGSRQKAVSPPSAGKQEDKTPTPASVPAPDEQAKTVTELHDKVAAVPRSSPATEEELAAPSKVAHAERVQQLLPVVRAGLDAIPTSETMTGELRGGGLRTHLSALNDILAHAARQKRGLTIGERKEYEENHRLLDAMLRRQGQDADRLKIKEG